MFQSTPSIAAGRTVSFPLHQPITVRFNPRPASLPGEPPSYRFPLPRCVVSIHAQHRCRANRPSSDQSLSRERFQSTPSIAAGRTYPRVTVQVAPVVFQSTPSIAAGRTIVCDPLAVVSDMFQSTPSIAAGRTQHAPHAINYALTFQSTPSIAAGRTANQIPWIV